MAKKARRLKQAATMSIVTVGLAMGVGTNSGTSRAAAASLPTTNSCRDFSAALFLKGEDLFHKVDPFLKFGGVETAFQKNGSNVGAFYKVRAGAAEVFLKDDVQDNASGVAFCIVNAAGEVTRGFFPANGSLDGAPLSFVKVNEQQAYFEVELQDATISSYFEVNESDIPVTVTVDKASPNLQ